MSAPARSHGGVLPERIDDPELAAAGLEVRTWQEADVPAMAAAILASVEHLRPFMPWAAQEPLPEEDRLAMVRDWEAARLAGGDVVYGIFHGGRVVGGTGAHRGVEGKRKVAADGLEIGYWLTPEEEGHGTMTRVVGALTRALLALPEITHVEIRMDEANVRSAAVPPRCGYRLVGREPRVPEAPSETAWGLCWRIGSDPVA
ncbi:MAG TPA: GNAT family N-acetyltransferase [Candidatus Nanopelagicales bacterium]